MEEDKNINKKKVLFNIATAIFIITFCFFEIGLIGHCVYSFFYGACKFNNPIPDYGLDAVKNTFFLWYMFSLLYLWPVTIFQIIYLIYFIKDKIKSIKKNSVINGENDAENLLMKVFVTYLCIIILIVVCFSLYFNDYMIINGIFVPGIDLLLFALVAYLPLKMIKKDTNISNSSVIILGYIFFISSRISIILGILLGILFLSTFFVFSFYIFGVLWKRNIANHNVVDNIPEKENH